MRGPPGERRGRGVEPVERGLGRGVPLGAPRRLVRRGEPRQLRAREAAADGGAAVAEHEHLVLAPEARAQVSEDVRCSDVQAVDGRIVKKGVAQGEPGRHPGRERPRQPADAPVGDAAGDAPEDLERPRPGKRVAGRAQPGAVGAGDQRAEVPRRPARVVRRGARQRGQERALVEPPRPERAGARRDEREGLAGRRQREEAAQVPGGDPRLPPSASLPLYCRSSSSRSGTIST